MLVLQINQFDRLSHSKACNTKKEHFVMGVECPRRPSGYGNLRAPLAFGMKIYHLWSQSYFWNLGLKQFASFKQRSNSIFTEKYTSTFNIWCCFPQDKKWSPFHHHCLCWNFMGSHHNPVHVSYKSVLSNRWQRTREQTKQDRWLFSRWLISNPRVVLRQ